MGSKKKPNSSSKSSSPPPSGDETSSISATLHTGLRERHQQELESLTLTTQPFKTLKFFFLALVQYVKQSVIYVLSKGGWILVFGILIAISGALLATIEGAHDKHIQELLQYAQYVLRWTALGVASSIGLGSGLHTFVLYLGPHIALFSIKATKCGRVDLKSAPYDTIQLKRGPSWLLKDCSEFGPPLFESVYGSRVPLMSILHQVQLEAILWGVGTALGELPPYFISRAAQLSGTEIASVNELDALAKDKKGEEGRFDRLKRWFISHAQYLNFGTILVLASVPNPLFDLAGILCGQFGVPFWEFFLATLIGKAIVKTHIQTIFIISVCNNQLLDWVENELIWVLSLIPGFSAVLPDIIAKLHSMKDKYLVPQDGPPSTKVKNWDLSFATIWNTVVWLVLVNFFFKIVNATAQSFLKKQQENERATLSKNKKKKKSISSTH